ncbi:RNA-directed DNA polymerase, eukaryota, reverse transcriptase zinc-binding domain protein [Tanacetum coccineum]
MVGAYNFQCKYIGGLWLWIELDSHEACLKMQSNKEMSCVSVKEFADWNPDIKDMDMLSSNNSEKDHSVKHEDDLSDNVFHDKRKEANKNFFQLYVNVEVLGYDMEGSKKDLKKFIDSLGVNQETHSTKLDPFKVKSAWGNFQFEFVERPSNGRSGWLWSLYGMPIVFSKINEFQFENFLIVEGNWIASHTHCFMINVYAPQDVSKKELLWNEILEFMNLTRLWDIPLGGHLFTRLNKHVDRLSKLDRFLASNSFAPILQKVSGHVLDCHISDHRPILLTSMSVDFGPTPFKFYNSWLLDKNLHSSINDFWDSYISVNCMNPIVSFKNKMKALKIVIKDWSLNRKDTQTREKEDLIKKINDFDANITTRLSDIAANDQRSIWIDNLCKIELNESIDSSQKLKIYQEQSAFIKHRQILDGPLMVNAVIQWFMHFMGFSDNWFNVDTVASFQATYRYLIIAMEVDALFIGEWSRNNIKSLVASLDRFYKFIGLKINYHKSKLFGVGVPFDEVSLLASHFWLCNALVSPVQLLRVYYRLQQAPCKVGIYFVKFSISSFLLE